MDLVKEANKNTFYRHIIYTLKNRIQIAFMSLHPYEDIPLERHSKIVQIITITKGEADIWINNEKSRIKEGETMIIKPDKWHYLRNASKNKVLKLYTIYIPPEHPSHRMDERQPE